jgi:hypothetical protein
MTADATRINRHDGPEDDALSDRCLTGGLPEFGTVTGSFRRIVQTPSKETMPSLVGCVERAWKNSPLQRDEVLIRRQEAAPQQLMALRNIRCGRS